MSKTKFTPGPWFVDADFYVYGGDGRKNQGEYFDGVEFPLVCDVESDSRDRTENKANAALIAAAPEMYGILEYYLDLIQRANDGDTISEQKIFEQSADIEKVLKKARGEE